MGCCIFVAMLVSQGLLFWEKTRSNRLLLLTTLAIGLSSLGMLVWHWHHIEELLLNPFAFTFISDLLNDPASFCRSVLAP